MDDEGLTEFAEQRALNSKVGRKRKPGLRVPSDHPHRKDGDSESGAQRLQARPSLTDTRGWAILNDARYLVVSFAEYLTRLGLSAPRSADAAQGYLTHIVVVGLYVSPVIA